MTMAVRSAGTPEPGAGRGVEGVVPRVALSGRLAASARVTVVSAPAGSGKTVLLRSWIAAARLTRRIAWVAVDREMRDPERFWPSVLGALRGTAAGSVLFGEVTAAPDLDGWSIVERLLADLASLEEPLWLVIDDVHELGSAETLRQLELLVLRAPTRLRFVLATRRDVRLGLHRLRLHGDLTEIRADDLRFSLAEAQELFAGSGVDLPETALAALHERTEGWAAGLRLAALSLAGHPDPGRFAAEFSGSERMVAEYLLAEVLERQDEEARRLLLRTSVLDRVNGELADLLSGGGGGERVLQDLERANAFVVSLDAARSWFRYHTMFADLLRFELRRTAPGEVAGLHRAAAGWFAGHGFPVEAIRHAQAARDWDLAARLLTDHWPGLHLDGEATAIHDLIAAFPAEVRAADSAVAAVAAADELAQGSLDAAEQYLRLAERGSASIPEARHGQSLLLLVVVRLLLARQRGNLPTVVEEAQRLWAMTGTPDAAQVGLGEDLQALALVSLGTTEYGTARFGDAVGHLQEGRAVAHRIGRPYLVFTGLAYQAAAEFFQSFPRASEHGELAMELARRHGWTDEPTSGIVAMVIAAVKAWQGRGEEAEPWIQRSERILRAESHPVAGMATYYVRGVVELARGRDADALAAFQAAERPAAQLARPNLFVTALRAFVLQTLVRLGDTGEALAGLGGQDGERGEMRITAAVLRLAQDDPRTAVAALAPVLDGSAPVIWPAWRAQAFLLEAIARDALGDQGAAERALERSLDLTEPDGVVLWFLLHPVPNLLERHARHRTTHAALIAEIQDLLSGSELTPSLAGPQPLLEPLRDSEFRVLRYLPTNLSVPEIAGELDISRNTVKTHMRNLYAKLGTHRRAETVERARSLGLLAPSARGR